ncbi:MAG: nicotinamide-nucleotide adenylyltransferase [Thermoplasmatota archaeon]
MVGSPRRALFIGRFQPFHNGHLEALRAIASTWNEVIVGVGSADASHTRDNPFTAGERIEMILESCREAGIANVLPMPIPDLNRNALWVSHVAALVPRFGALYSNNALPRRLFQEAGYDVRDFPLHDRDHCQGRVLRAAMIQGDAWEKSVPPATRRILAEVGGVERMRTLERSDTK